MADNRYVKSLWIVFLTSLVLSCGLEAADTLATVERTVPHSGYSEGLEFHEGHLWHALPKKIVKIDPKTGEALLSFRPATEYSESVTWFQGYLWNVSYSDNGLYRGKPQGKGEFAFKRVGSVPEAHAWGLTNDGKHLIVTGNYSNKLYFLDPKSAKVVRTLEVDVRNLEDLAWDGEALWSSSFTHHKGKVFRIDPKTGKVTHFFKLPQAEQCPVIDGIAFDGTGFWITGKHCISLYYMPHPLKKVVKKGKKSAARANASK